MKRRTIVLLLYFIIILIVSNITPTSKLGSTSATTNQLPSNLPTNGVSNGCDMPPSSPGWTKSSGNPVLDIGAAGTWDSGAVTLPDVIFDGSVYRMWYTGQGDGSQGDKSTRIGYATSSDGVTWTKHASNPVLTIGPSGGWDSKDVAAPYVIFDQGLYKMWYVGNSDPTTSSGAIGYATSPDGITWTKYERNPLLTVGPAGSWDSAKILGVSVLAEGNAYKMWYTGSASSEPFLKLRIGYATSSDGTNWEKYTGNPVLDTSPPANWDSLFFPKVLFNGSIYEMWFSGFSLVLPISIEFGIGHASSKDGVHWNQDGKDINNLVKGPPNTWDSQLVGLSTVILQNGTYQMWYTGGDSLVTESGAVQKNRIGAATSQRSIGDRADDVSGYQVHIIYVLPSDGTDRGLDTSGRLNISVCAFQHWLIGQTGGPGLRLDHFFFGRFWIDFLDEPTTKNK
ncbi:MAG TPA: hypothetical protein VK206_02905 [Anaerolineales bacterium]|nr:hypothetical protein [Anaerolineales bacterium]